MQKGLWAQLSFMRTLGVMSCAQFSALMPESGCLQMWNGFPTPTILLSYFATPPIPFPFPSLGWTSRVDLQSGKMAFASLQRWGMLSKHVPDGVCASDPARMLLPCWGYQGTAGPGDGFWLILSGWKSTCASWRRGQRVCAQGSFPGEIPSWHEGKIKS